MNVFPSLLYIQCKLYTNVPIVITLVSTGRMNRKRLVMVPKTPKTIPNYSCDGRRVQHGRGSAVANDYLENLDEDRDYLQKVDTFCVCAYLMYILMSILLSEINTRH